MPLSPAERAEILARQDDTIAAAQLALEQIPAASRLHFYTVAEYAGCNRYLDKIQAITGDARSQRELMVAVCCEALRRATAPTPARVRTVEKAPAKKTPAKRSPAKKRKK